MGEPNQTDISLLFRELEKVRAENQQMKTLYSTEPDETKVNLKLARMKKECHAKQKKRDYKVYNVKKLTAEITLLDDEIQRMKATMSSYETYIRRSNNTITHMQDLKDVTRDVHYESYRAQYITKISQQAARERNKLRRDSGPNFESISEADRLLQQKEEEIRRMQDMLQQMQQKLRAAGNSLAEGGPDGDNKKDNDSIVNL